jgi:hypothetical protein
MKLAFLIAAALALPMAARAQLTLESVNGSTQTPVGATFSFGSVASGSSAGVVFRALNTGSSAVVIDTLSLSGAGFSISAVNGTLPYTIAPGNFLGFTVQFTAGSPAAYSAGLLVENISVLLLANSVVGPTVSFFPPCALAGPNGVNFGTLTNGSLHLCNFLISNGNTQPITISTIAVTGAFQASQVPALPVTLPPGQGTMFVVEITPGCGTQAVTGTLTVNTASYALSGQGADPPLPTPVLALDVAALGSGEQHSLTMSLASPAACAMSGNVNLVFTPSKNLPVGDDTSIVFLSGSTRSLQFSATPGSSAVTIAGQASAAFQTGTTAGTITFTVSGIPGTSLPSISFAIAPASNQITGQLDLEVIGYDNTYSAGPMTFTFYDANNNIIGSAISANFASNFQSYFAMYKSGSSFLARVSFPLQGSGTVVTTLTATLSNNAGATQTGTLTFQ